MTEVYRNPSEMKDTSRGKEDLDFYRFVIQSLPVAVVTVNSARGNVPYGVSTKNGYRSSEPYS
jgi:hypothetical protein